MIHETGSSTSPKDLLSKFLNFAVNDMGWTKSFDEDETGSQQTSFINNYTGRGGEPNQYARIEKTGNSELRFALRAVNLVTGSVGNVGAGGTDSEWNGILVLGADSFHNDKGWRSGVSAVDPSGEDPEFRVPGDQTTYRSSGDRIVIGGSSSGNDDWYSINSVSYDSTNDETVFKVNSISSEETGLTCQFLAWWEHPGRPEMRNKSSSFGDGTEEVDAFDPNELRPHLNGIGFRDGTDLSFNTYHFFGSTAPEQLWCWAEYASGQWLWFGLGEINRTNSGMGDGRFYTASMCNTDDTDWDQGNVLATHNTIPFQVGGGQFYDSSDYQGYGSTGSNLRVDIDGFNSWATNTDEQGDYGSAPPGQHLGQAEFFASVFIHGELLRNSPNNFNEVSTLIPFNFYVGQGTEELFGHVGSIPEVRWLNMENHQPGDEITYGSDTWLVLPGHRKYDPSQEGHNFNHGVAFKLG